MPKIPGPGKITRKLISSYRKRTPKVSKRATEKKEKRVRQAGDLGTPGGARKAKVLAGHGKVHEGEPLAARAGVPPKRQRGRVKRKSKRQEEELQLSRDYDALMPTVKNSHKLKYQKGEYTPFASVIKKRNPAMKIAPAPSLSKGEQGEELLRIGRQQDVEKQANIKRIKAAQGRVAGRKQMGLTKRSSGGKITKPRGWGSARLPSTKT